MSNDTRQEGQVSLDSAKDSAMTEGEILALEGDDLRVSVEVLLGGRFEGHCFYDRTRQHIGDLNADGDLEMVGSRTIPAYHKSLDAIRPVVLKCVEECGESAYLGALTWLLDVSTDFALFRATATDQARAVLLAYHRKATAKADSQVGEALEPEKPTRKGEQSEPKERP